ncbi:MAG: hydroxymethylglutaryl-CoA lyase [Armatimonadota bacterium]|nr:hydroxymethylglutaryl-CoA lyase [Armatimonadota bacterium]
MIRIVEVGPRDGLQNIAQTIPTEVKVAFIDALSETGIDEIEVASFVSPKWVPQMADGEEVCARIKRKEGVTYMALVPNERGLERAIEGKVDKIAVFTAASESFSQKNTNATIAETIERFKPVIASSPVPTRGYVSTAFYCPYEGHIDPAKVVAVVRRLLDIGCIEISIGDTIGKATPEEVRDLLGLSLPICPPEKTALHFHDTFGNAILNAKAANEMGITVFDSSASGIGGCPFAPGARGNVSTEALLDLFSEEISIDRSLVVEAGAIVAPYVN